MLVVPLVQMKVLMSVIPFEGVMKAVQRDASKAGWLDVHSVDCLADMMDVT